MTHKTALQKLDRAIEYLKEHAAQMPPMKIVGGKIKDEERRGVRDATRVLGVAMCDVVRAMATPDIQPSHPPFRDKDS
jgi:hypothetical protein